MHTMVKKQIVFQFVQLLLYQVMINLLLHANVLIYLKVQDGSFVKQVTVAKKSTGNMVARGNVIATYSEKNLVIVKDSDVKTIALSYVPTYVTISREVKKLLLVEMIN